MHTSIENSTIIITGANGGIAKACAKLLTRYGANLVVTTRDKDKLAPVLSDLGDKAQGHILDVSNPQDVEAFFERVGAFDHLITPAASSLIAPLSDLDLNEARTLIESKQLGQLYCVKYGSNHIHESGSITLFSGTVTQKPMAGASMFAAVGAATEAAARIWALELAPVRINTIVPGIIDTPVWAGLMGDAAKEQLQAFADMLPVGRIGTPEDIAKTAAFLIDNGFIDGQTIVVDGGHRLI